jgi:transposase
LLEDGVLEIGAIHTYVEIYARLLVDLIPSAVLVCAEQADYEGNLYTGPNTEDTPVIVEAAAFHDGIVIVQANEKLSNDPRFAEKLEDVVDLYLNPPADAIVLSLDEKCQIQAWERTQPGLPWKKGRYGTMTGDYKRHGTTTLFAAMNTQDGTVIDVCMPTHNHKDWIRFLKLIDGRTPKDKALHPIMDNYAAHKTPEVKAWLDKHPRFHVHFTPTSSSWLNQVERFFRDLTEKCIRRGVFHSVAELQQAMRVYIDRHNQNPKPYLWTKKAKDILEKVKRAWQALTARGYAPKKLAALLRIERSLAAATAS